MDVTFTLLIISAIIFFGFLAEYIEKKFKIPDILSLIILGFLLGPFGLKYVNLNSIYPFVPLFTTFALIFILFDGAFSIDINSMFNEISKSLIITITNFLVSSIVIAIIMNFFGLPISISILMGFMLGGISSSFVIPLLKGLGIKNNSYSLLTIESALTDVLCIVFSMAMLEFIKFQSFSLLNILWRITLLFGIAGIIGISGGIIWIILVSDVFKNHKTYMDTISFLLLIYVITEYLHGNGALAALFFGIMLKNSKYVTFLLNKENVNFGVSVTKPSERNFYDQITFFIKTFFFVYIGLMFDISDYKALVIGSIISVSIMIIRNISSVLVSRIRWEDKILINSVFGRGISAAVLAQIAIEMNIPYSIFISKVVYIVIVETIFLSSTRVFVNNLIKNKNEGVKFIELEKTK